MVAVAVSVLVGRAVRVCCNANSILLPNSAFTAIIVAATINSAISSAESTTRDKPSGDGLQEKSVMDRSATTKTARFI